MPRAEYMNCRHCGKHKSEVGEMSHERLCSVCSAELLTSNIVQMMTRSGPNFSKWRRAMAACVGGTLLDDTTPSA